jgi:inorganic pyrophosphatase
MVLQSADGGKHHTAPMLFGLHTVMLGRQGSGKGTQGMQLARLLVVPHISVGDVLREAVRSESPAGRRARETMERGELVDNDLVVSLVAERLAAADVRSGGFVLDGFPRTVEQAKALADILADVTLDRAVVIDVPLEVAQARLLARRVCTGCGRIYSVERARGLETWTCGACGGEVCRRGDDTEEAVRRRLALYDKQTRPLLDWFDRHDQLLVVDGVGTSEEVFTRLLAGLWPRIPTDRIAQLAGVSEPVPTEPAAAAADEDLSALAVEVVIEVPRGSRNKYEFDHERHVLHLDRRLFSATVYPADYGFIPGTLAEDGDPLDALVLLEEPVFPGCWVRARPVGIFWMEDEKGPDAKIICVPLGDPRWDQVRDLGDMPTHLRSEIHHFFDVYKALEPGKSTSTAGFEAREAALGEIAASRARLLHHQRTGEATGQGVPREAVPVAGGLPVRRQSGILPAGRHGDRKARARHRLSQAAREQGMRWLEHPKVTKVRP